MPAPFPFTMRGRALAAAVVLAALPALAACSGSETPSGTSSHGARLSMAIKGNPGSFDITQINSGQGAYVWSAVYDTLLYTDNKGKIEPNAAESYVYSADRKTLTLKLRKGMTFTSGAPVNAAAVKTTLDRIRTTPGPTKGALTAVESVAAPDDLTVVIKLARPDAALLTNLSQAAGAIGDPATMTQPGSATNPVGSGPYTLDKSATVNGSTYTLKKRAGYWNAAAYPMQTVRIRVMNDDAASSNALQAGELNAGSVDWTKLPAMKAKGLQITTIPAYSMALLMLADRTGTVLKPLGDVRVRQAINMAFDRTKLVGAFLKGSGRPSTQIYNPKGAAYDAALDEKYPFDKAAAKKLLADAGYPAGFPVTMPSFAYTKPFEPTVTQALGDIGIKVSWTPVSPTQQNSAKASKKYPMYFDVQGVSNDPVQTVTFLGAATAENPFGSTDPKLTKLMDQADEADRAQADEIYKKINAFVVDNAWFAPVFDIGVNWVTARGIRYLGDGSSTICTIRAFGTA